MDSLVTHEDAKGILQRTGAKCVIVIGVGHDQERGDMFSIRTSGVSPLYRTLAAALIPKLASVLEQDGSEDSQTDRETYAHMLGIAKGKGFSSIGALFAEFDRISELYDQSNRQYAELQSSANLLEQRFMELSSKLCVGLSGIVESTDYMEKPGAITEHCRQIRQHIEAAADELATLRNEREMVVAALDHLGVPTKCNIDPGITLSIPERVHALNINMVKGRMIIPEGLNAATADLVVAFANKMAEKLFAAQQKRNLQAEWSLDDWKDDCLEQFENHIRKGDPVDVANYCAFMEYHGWPTSDTSAFVQLADLKESMQKAQNEMRETIATLAGAATGVTFVDSLPQYAQTILDSLKAQRARIEQEREKAQEATRALNLCAAHIGLKHEKCPCCVAVEKDDLWKAEVENASKYWRQYKGLREMMTREMPVALQMVDNIPTKSSKTPLRERIEAIISILTMPPELAPESATNEQELEACIKILKSILPQMKESEDVIEPTTESPQWRWEANGEPIAGVTEWPARLIQPYIEVEF